LSTTITKNRWLRPAACLVVAAAAAVLAGCGPKYIRASTNIPTPLVAKIPITIALFIPTEFSTYVHKEERWSTNWNVALGGAQTEGLTRLLNAMFERVVMVDSVNAGAQLGPDVKAILEPSIEEYAFVTPRDAGSPFYAVSIKYRVNVYMPDGKLADSWGFTGYGTSPSQGLSSTVPLQAATALAMRDAGARLAVEFREQAVVRGLLPESDSADTTPAPAPASAGASPATQQPSQPSDQPPADPQPAGVQPPPAAPPTESSGAPEEEDKSKKVKLPPPEALAAAPGPWT
jgi:hypothetical protein